MDNPKDKETTKEPETKKPEAKKARGERKERQSNTYEKIEVTLDTPIPEKPATILNKADTKTYEKKEAAIWDKINAKYEELRKIEKAGNNPEG